MTQHTLPNLIIAGVNKAGTTSLFTYLGQHPAICAASIKETNYFVPILYGKAPAPLDDYAAFFRDGAAQRYRLEASPRYVYGGARMAESIREALGPIRVIFLLRRPTDRLVSYYKHMKRTQEIPPTISCDEYAKAGQEQLSAALARATDKPIDVYQETVYVRGLAQGLYVDYLEGWYGVFPDSIRVCFFEDLKLNPKGLMLDLCEWLGVESSVYEKAKFSQENRSMTHRNGGFHRLAESVNQRWEPFWRRHRMIKRFARDVYSRLNEKRSKEQQLSTEQQAELASVYAPYNHRLSRMLSAKGYRNLPNWLSTYSVAHSIASDSWTIKGIRGPKQCAG